MSEITLTGAGDKIEPVCGAFLNALRATFTVEAFATAAQAFAAANGFDLLIFDGPVRTSQATLEIPKQQDAYVLKGKEPLVRPKP